jgi:hypothetical protein
VLDAARQVFVSSDPKRLPLLTPESALPGVHLISVQKVTVRIASNGAGLAW